jgi:hypothetical protein
LIQEYDDGKSKSFFCLAAALLEVDDLNEVLSQVEVIQANLMDKKQRTKQTRSLLEQQARLKGTPLIYRREKA